MLLVYPFSSWYRRDVYRVYMIDHEKYTLNSLTDTFVFQIIDIYEKIYWQFKYLIYIFQYLNTDENSTKSAKIDRNTNRAIVRFFGANGMRLILTDYSYI